MKRVLSFILTICLLLVLAPKSTLQVNAGSYGSLTEEAFAKKVSQVMTQYPHGKFWNQYNGVDSDGIALAGDKICPGKNKTTKNKCTAEGYCGIHSKAGCDCKCGYFHGWQCHGFANLMAYKFFGSFAISSAYNTSGINSSKGWACSKSVNEYYAGDFVRIKEYSHSIFIYKVEGNTITYVDCNNTGKPCQIAWGKTISVSQLKDITSYVAHLKGNTLKGTGKSVESTISYTKISAGNYYLKNKASGKYLTVADGMDKEKQTIHMYKFVSGGTKAQVYKIYEAKDGYLIMPLCSTTRVVNPYAWTVVPGKEINLYSLTNESSQWWKFQKNGDTYVLRNVQNPSVCLTNSSADKLTVETYTGAESQLWYLEAYKEEYTISYNANGGTGEPAKQTKEQGVNLKLSSKKPTWDGHTFLGWSTDSKATSATYQPGGIFDIDKDITLYAVWQQGCENDEHTYDYSEVKAPTSTSTGILSGRCTNCDKTIEKTIPALNERDYHYQVIDEPTCTEDGRGCYTYSEISYKVFVAIPKIEHNLQETVAAVAATCETVGKTAISTCAICGKVEGGEEIPALGHNMQESAAATEPTCTAAGKTATMACANGCGKTEGGEEIPAKGHNLVDGVCSICGQGAAVLGDANGDGKVNLRDAILVLQASNGKDVAVDRNAADVTGDGKMNIRDAILILKRANGNKDPFPAEK